MNQFKHQKRLSFAFQSPRPSSALTPEALEGLFNTLLHRLNNL